ncbi:MAG: hypothetical protein QNL69_05440 [Acidimicrobiales bacterium]
MAEHQGLPAGTVANALSGAEDSCDQTRIDYGSIMQEAPSGKGALPAYSMVSGVGFEPTTFGLCVRRATRSKPKCCGDRAEHETSE